MSSRKTMALLVIVGCLPQLVANTPAVGQETPSTEASEAARRLISAYPDFLDRQDGNALVWRDGKRMTLDDLRGPKEPANRIEAPDLKDMLTQPYPLGLAPPPAFQSDPGRARNNEFFVAMYGDCLRGGTRADLMQVKWLPRKWGKTVEVTRINGVDKRLAAVSAELDALPSRFDTYLFPPGGGFNCRPIAGTDRVSPHGFGIAIDIAIKHTDYWHWTKPDRDGRYPYRNRIPAEIVAIFEKHGFIWGGKWYHYDTMHFEYRPELLMR
jgi:hypothetical protein